MREVKLPFYAHLVLVLLAIVLVLFLLSIGAVVFIPLFFALLLSVLIFPLAKRMEEVGMPRNIATLLSLLIFIACAGAFLYIMVLQVISFSEDLPQFQECILALFSDLQAFVSKRYHVNASQQIDYLNKVTSGMLAGLANSVQGIFASVLEIIVWTIFVFIFTYFMLFHRSLLYRFIMALFPPRQKPKVVEVISDTRSIVNYYVTGLLLEMAIMSVINCGVFAIMGIKYALLLGMIAAVFNIIPYLGIYTAMVICMLVTFANGSAGQAVSVAVALIVIHFIDANILLPRIVGARVKMNALVTIIAVIIGSQVWGIAGMFLFIPLAAILKIVFERVEGLQPWAMLIGTEEKKLPEKNTGSSGSPGGPAQE